jgi:hypothetical protein
MYPRPRGCAAQGRSIRKVPSGLLRKEGAILGNSLESVYTQTDTKAGKNFQSEGRSLITGTNDQGDFTSTSKKEGGL